MEPFSWNDYAKLVDLLLPPIGKSAGYSDKALAVAEKRLGMSLPKRLREFYSLAGKRDDINADYNRLMAPEDLDVDDNVLVFYEENQSVCHWGIDLAHMADEDPPVLRRDQTANPSWESDFSKVSDFLLAMLFMQAANTMRVVGVGTMPRTAIDKLSDGWETKPSGGTWKSRATFRDGELVFVYGGDDPLEVFVGAKTKRQFLRLEKELQASFDYCTLDDE